MPNYGFYRGYLSLRGKCSIGKSNKDGKGLGKRLDWSGLVEGLEILNE